MERMSSNAPEPVFAVCAGLVCGWAAYVVTSGLVPRLGDAFIDRGLKGVDMLKDHEVPSTQEGEGGEFTRSKETRERNVSRKGPELPESTGVIGAVVYILLVTTFIPVIFHSSIKMQCVSPEQQQEFQALSSSPLSSFVNITTYWTTVSCSDEQSNGSPTEDSLGLKFPHHSLSAYLASLLSLLIATFLGFLDDLFDIRWRYKLPIPVIASIPLLVVYYAGGGITDIVVPNFLGLRWLLGTPTGGPIHLGPLYYLYMSMLSTFCTNSINILAGINGVEATQSLVIAITIAINDLLYIPLDLGRFGVWGIGFDRGSSEMVDRHLFSFYFMIPLIGTSLGLLRHNWYPAKSFVGDTLCYFAGMAFAVVGILGHFSKTLLLFFIPQVFNFLLSSPQIFKLVPCPRHRLPRLNKQTGLLEPSKVPLSTTKLSRAAKICIYTFENLGMIGVDRSHDGAHITACTNMTILNMVLVRAGSMSEERLTRWMVGLQVLGSIVGFVVRYLGAGLVF